MIIDAGKLFASMSVIITIIFSLIYHVYAKDLVQQIQKNTANSIIAKSNSLKNYFCIKELLTKEEHDEAIYNYEEFNKRN